MPQVNERRAVPDGAAVSRRARRLAWALLGVTIALLAAGPVIGLTGGEPWSAEFGFIPVALAFAVVGALVAARTGNRLGWLFLAAAAISAVTVAANAYAARPARAGLPGAAWVGWAFTVLLGITGSLFYDIDHKPGVVGPVKFRSHLPSAWEIHPISSIERAN